MRSLHAPLVLAVLILASVATLPVTHAQTTYTLTLTVVGADNKPLTGVTVYLYDTDGNQWSAETDANGIAKFTVKNGTYLVFVKASYAILTTVTVAGDTSATINASAMHHANLTSVPVSVTATVTANGFPVQFKLDTNVTIYSDEIINVSFPKEVVKLPYKYVLDRIEYDGTTTNESSVSLDLSTKDYSVVAHYTQTFAVTLQLWMVLLLVAILVIALVVAFRVATKTASTMIAEYIARNRKFVSRR